MNERRNPQRRGAAEGRSPPGNVHQPVVLSSKASPVSGEVNGRKIGVMLATKNPRFDTYALNESDVDALRRANEDGRVDHAFVVLAVTDGTGSFDDGDYRGAIELTELIDGIREHELRVGIHGPFWVLPHHIKDQFDEPF